MTAMAYVYVSMLGAILVMLIVVVVVVATPPCQVFVAAGSWANISDHVPYGVHAVYLVVEEPNSKGKLVPARMIQLKRIGNKVMLQVGP